MARRCTFNLDYANPRIVESYAEHFVIGGYRSNGDERYFLDIFLPYRNREPKCRINILDEFKSMESSYNLKSLDRVIFPRLKWSDR